MSFSNVVRTGKESLVRWYVTTHPQLGSNSKTNAFGIACERGFETIAKYIYSLGNVDIHHDADSFFSLACSNGHDTIARWLYSLGGFNIRQAFDEACMSGHEGVARWLYSLGGIDDIDNAFQVACPGGHETLAKWLYEIGFHGDLTEVFLTVCAVGNDSVAKWLYSLGIIDIHSNNEQALKVACYNDMPTIALWLYDLGANTGSLRGENRSKLAEWRSAYRQRVSGILEEVEALEQQDRFLLREMSEYVAGSPFQIRKSAKSRRPRLSR